MEMNNTEAGEGYTELSQEEFKEILAKERKKGLRRGILYTLLGVAVAAIILFAVLVIAEVKSGSKTSNSRFTEIADEDFQKKADYLWAVIESRFLWEDDVNADKTRDDMYAAMLSSLDDPYSCYYNEEDFANMIEDNSGEYSGIGAYISQNPDTRELYIARPMPDSPAEAAGIVADDYIITVDGEDISGQDLTVVVSKIKGPEGTTVTLGIKHNNEGEVEEITVERHKIEVKRIEHEMLDDKIGYIWIYEFEQKTDSQFNAAYEELKSQGMEGLIIDLRDNPGGDLSVVCTMADKFLDEGIICYTKDKNGGGDTHKSDAACEKLPIVILTNGNSASASEIFTGSLKDRGVAKVVGTTTFGKGIVQGVYSLNDGTGYKITEAEYYLPNDECIHGVGIEPDVEIELDKEAYLKDKTDNQKNKAIEVMKGLLGK